MLLAEIIKSQKTLQLHLFFWTDPTFSDGARTLTANQSFFPGYRKTALHANEILRSILIPFSSCDQYYAAYKQSRRRRDDISIVCAAFKLQLDDNGKIRVFRAAFGGMAPRTVLAGETAAAIVGKLVSLAE